MTKLKDDDERAAWRAYAAAALRSVIRDDTEVCKYDYHEQWSGFLYRTVEMAGEIADAMLEEERKRR